MSHDWPYPEILKNEKNDLKRKLLLSLLIGVSITTVTNAAPNVDYLQKKYNISSQEEIDKNKEIKSTVNPTHNRAFGSGPVAIKNEKIDKAIMAANVGSLAPGIIGAGSALAATGLELVRDLGDPEKSG